MKRHTAKGSGLVEFACSICVLSVITLLCLNVCILVFGTVVNDQCCRDAARAASQCNSSATALAVARAAVAAHKTDGYFITAPQVAASGVVYEDFGGRPLPDQVPKVSVTTTCKIRIPAPLLFFQANLTDGTINSVRTYVFPVTNYNLDIPGESQT
jgi:hypothetical protein